MVCHGARNALFGSTKRLRGSWKRWQHFCIFLARLPVMIEYVRRHVKQGITCAVDSVGPSVPLYNESLVVLCWSKVTEEKCAACQGASVLPPGIFGCGHSASPVVPAADTFVADVLVVEDIAGGRVHG